MNYVVLIGRLCADPDYRLNQGGKATCRIRLAVSRGFKNSKGEIESDFMNCVAFGKTSELINQYCHKGDLVGINGSIRTGNYTDKQGGKRYTTDIAINKITFLNAKKETKEPVNNDPFQDFGDMIEVDDNFLD